MVVGSRSRRRWSKRECRTWWLRWWRDRRESGESSKLSTRASTTSSSMSYKPKNITEQNPQLLLLLLLGGGLLWWWSASNKRVHLLRSICSWVSRAATIFQTKSTNELTQSCLAPLDFFNLFSDKEVIRQRNVPFILTGIKKVKFAKKGRWL